MTRLSRMLDISRASAYRAAPAPAADEMRARDAIQRIALAWPKYGYRPMLHELLAQRFVIGERRVRRLRRLDNLLRQRRWRKAVPRYRAHGLETYPNLARRFDLRALALWLRVHGVLMDAFIRRSLVWAVEETFEDELTLSALGMALRRRRPAPALLR